MTDSITMTAAVLMAVYRKDDPHALHDALAAVDRDQTLAPDLLLIVLDGPVPDALWMVLSDWDAASPTPVEIVELPENRGLSCALRAGVEALRGRVRYVLRTDADDLNRPERNAAQIAWMEAHPQVGVASSQVAIFAGTPENRTGQRVLPADGSIGAYGRSRTPINHSATILRMAALERLNYPETRLPFEDWWICLRLQKAGWQIGVIDEEHLDFRGGADMIARRRGRKYMQQEITYFRQIHAEGLMPTALVVKNLAMRLTLRALPAGLIQAIYARLLHR